MDKPTCPVCKSSRSTVITHVYLGHGHYTEHACTECEIIFPWGSNKYGDITDTDQIEKVAPFHFPQWEQAKNMIKPEDHESFEPKKFCVDCGKQLNDLKAGGTGSMGDSKGIHCHPTCK